MNDPQIKSLSKLVGFTQIVCPVQMATNFWQTVVCWFIRNYTNAIIAGRHANPFQLNEMFVYIFQESFLCFLLNLWKNEFKSSLTEAGYRMIGRRPKDIPRPGSSQNLKSAGWSTNHKNTRCHVTFVPKLTSGVDQGDIPPAFGVCLQKALQKWK